MHGTIEKAFLLTDESGVMPSYTYHFASTLPGVVTTSYAEQSSPNVIYQTNACDFYNASVYESEVALSLTRISGVSAVSFAYSSSTTADIVITGLDVHLSVVGDPTKAVAGFAYFPAGTDPRRSDMYLTAHSNMTANDLTVQAVVSHELNHTIGMKDAAGTLLCGTDEDSQRYTIMSYNKHPGALREVEELQLYDVAALQSLYGQSSQDEGDTLHSNFLDSNGLARMYSIWDSGGDDTISAAPQRTAALIDLRPGFFSSIGPDTQVQVSGAGGVPTITSAGHLNVSIAFGSYIENATGSDFSDLIIGNLLSNTLSGGHGDDIIYGDGNASAYDQGEIADNYRQVTNVADLSEAAPPGIAAFVDDHATQIDTIHGGDGDDLIVGGEGSDQLYGDAGIDTLRGSTGNDTMYGGDGDDTLEGGQGSDIMFGGEGNDWLSGYLDSDGGIALADDGARDHLYGGDGSDMLSGYGDDQLFGGIGFDLLVIENPSGAILNGGGSPDFFHVMTSSNFTDVDLLITDSDLMDQLVLNDQVLNGGIGYAPPGTEPTQVSDDLGNVYTNDIASATLTIQLAGGAGLITVLDYVNGDMGVDFIRIHG